MDTKRYKTIGVATFVTQREYARYGHLEQIENHPVFIYERTGADHVEGIEYWCHEEMSLDKKYMVLYDYMIEKRYTVEEAQQEFPELFL